MVPSCYLILPRCPSIPSPSWSFSSFSAAGLEPGTPPRFCSLNARGSWYQQWELGSWRTTRCTELPVACKEAPYAAVISDCWATRESDTSDLLYLPQQEQLWLFAGHSIMCSTEKAGRNGKLELQNTSAAPVQPHRSVVHTRKQKAKANKETFWKHCINCSE